MQEGGYPINPPTIIINLKGENKRNMSNLKAKELLAEKFNNYMNREIEMSEGEFTEQDDTTVVGIIYNRIFKNQIQMNNLEKKYINENKEIDIKKATKRKKELAAEISRVQKQLNNYTKSYLEEIEKLEEKELKDEQSVMKRISIVNKYKTLEENLEGTPIYQNLSTELNDLNVEQYLLDKKIRQYEEDNKDFIREIMQEKRKKDVEKYLQSKEI